MGEAIPFYLNPLAKGPLKAEAISSLDFEEVQLLR